MEKSSGTIQLDKTGIESVQRFYDWLQGGDGSQTIHLAATPKLTAEEAFSVIYYLQEELNVLPDYYEQCRGCKELYDSYNEGTNISKDSAIVDKDGNEVDGNFPEELYGMYCDNCRPD